MLSVRKLQENLPDVKGKVWREMIQFDSRGSERMASRIKQVGQMVSCLRIKNVKTVRFYSKEKSQGRPNNYNFV